jgi:hypothetical protein
MYRSEYTLLELSLLFTSLAVRRGITHSALVESDGLIRVCLHEDTKVVPLSLPVLLYRAQFLGLQRSTSRLQIAHPPIPCKHEPPNLCIQSLVSKSGEPTVQFSSGSRG